MPEITRISCSHPDAPEPGGFGSPFVTTVSSAQVTEDLVHKCLLLSVLTAYLCNSLWEQSQASFGFPCPICSMPLEGKYLTHLYSQPASSTSVLLRSDLLHLPPCLSLLGWFETRPHKPRLALNLRSFSLSLLSVEVTGHHHSWTIPFCLFPYSVNKHTPSIFLSSHRMAMEPNAMLGVAAARDIKDVRSVGETERCGMHLEEASWRLDLAQS